MENNIKMVNLFSKKFPKALIVCIYDIVVGCVF
jgi:hypothetical protein